MQHSESTGTTSGAQNSAGRGCGAAGDDVQQLQRAAARAAAQLLIDTISDEGVKLELRIACAERLLERVYGKHPAVPESDAAGELNIIISGEAEGYSA